MSPVPVPASFLAKLTAADAPIELLAADGTRAGYFCPGKPKTYTPEELAEAAEGRNKSGVTVLVLTTEANLST